ncbi:unnamed protein product [Phytophthora fragariaefolia]|uniref:Unnamed protein product n=1 Tax=Phytophthora fragariaefolia TaxID=1490495 RepID=A0A9W6U0H2_9STRA|nr:unnamed protein product [Phytophthora fragariaefolia]
MVAPRASRSGAPSATTITAEHALQSIATLRSINDDGLADRANVLHMARDDDVNSPTPIYHSYLDSDPESVRTMTNFGPAEFERLWTLVCDHVVMNWNTGRGKKCSYSAKDVLFMLLTVLKNGGKWDVVAVVFRAVVPENGGHVCLDRVALPVRALGHISPGQVPDEEDGAQWAGVCQLSADFKIFRKNAEFHLQALRKAEANADIEDEGWLIAQYPSGWAVLADKGYQGLAHDFRPITPHKRASLQQLTLEHVATNERIAHDRIVVKNYFERLCSLWAICADKYRWDEDSYDVYFQACVAFTNFHIRDNPLRRVDGET